MMGNDREIIVAENIYDEKKHTIIHKNHRCCYQQRVEPV
jgi:hypothetical protein